MKKIVSFLLLVLVLSCSKSEDDTPENVATTFYLEIDNPYDRITFNQITLPNYVFYPTSQQETFRLDKGMPAGLNDVRVTLSGKCSVGNRDISLDVFVNFLEDKPTVVFTITQIVTCSPTIVTTYK